MKIRVEDSAAGIAGQRVACCIHVLGISLLSFRPFSLSFSIPLLLFSQLQKSLQRLYLDLQLTERISQSSQNIEAFQVASADTTP
jgi:hypothetical protein